ncbi:signal recognition particle-docking protein FtsY [Aurantivibrio plasticivorans]
MFFRRKKKSEPTESATTATQDASTAVGDSPSDQPSDPETPLVAEAASAPNTESEQAAHTQNEATDDKKESVFARIKRGLSRTTNQLGDGIGNLVLGKKEIDDELLEDIESQLLMADVGVDATTKIIDDLTQRVARKQLADGDALFKALRESLTDMLKVVEAPLVIDTSKQPFVVLVVGVNGVGKTTTIGKLAKRFQNQGHSVMLAAGDTFRAAAVEQLKVWGERNDVPVVAQATGSDSASVIFDAVQSAQARNIDIVIADTAGRLHNKSHLMDELSKVRRVMAKLDDSAPHETLLVLDAGTGQNALSQAEQFNQAVGVTGIALTKLDGTAKGGVVFALSEKFALPVRYIGVGEAIDDLQPFAADAFAEAVFSQGS